MAILAKAALLAELDVKLPANNTGAITPAEHKALLRDIIDSSAAGAGSPVRNRLQWDPTNGWTPVSDASVQYLIINRSDTFISLQEAIKAHLTLGGNENVIANPAAFVSTRLNSYASIGGINTSGNDAMLDDLWPLGQDAPFAWLCSPAPAAWLERSRANVSTRVDNTGTGTVTESMVSFGRLPYQITIDDAVYECGRYRSQLDRPVDAQATPLEAAFRIQYRFAPPPPEAPVVEQIL